MNKLSIVGLSIGTALLCAVPVSLQLTRHNMLSVSLDRADARVGRPLTPGSVAGVHRRVERRAYRRGYYGAPGAFYGGGYYGGQTYDYVPGQTYDYAPGGSEAWCAARYRSYNPETGMFLGYDRRYHPCP
jgi:BA14K-like protein